MKTHTHRYIYFLPHFNFKSNVLLLFSPSNIPCNFSISVHTVPLFTFFFKASLIMIYGIIYLNQHPIINWSLGSTVFGLDFE